MRKKDMLDVLRIHIGRKPFYDGELDQMISHVEKALYYKDETSIAWMLTHPDTYIRTLAKEIIKNGNK